MTSEMIKVFFLLIYFIQFTRQTELSSRSDGNLSGISFRNNEYSFFHFFVFFLHQVIFNLINIPQLIDYGWIPVNDTSNTTLTENLLATVDIG